MSGGTAADLVERSLARGARAAEAMVKVGATRRVSLEAGGAISWTRSAEGGVALRAFTAGAGCGFASACGPDLNEEGARSLVEASLGAARAGGGASFDLPSDAVGDGRGLGIFDPRLHSATPSDLEGLLDQAASEALRSDPRVRRLESASIAVSSTEVTLYNSAGLTGSYRQTLLHLSLGVTADDAGGRVVVRRTRAARSLSAFSAALFGDETGRLAATAVEGRPPAEGVFPALLAPSATVEVLRLLARRLEPPGPPCGAPLASRFVTLIDDGRLPGGVSTAPFDGEGVPTQRTRLVAAGGSAGTIHDLTSAARWGAASTGNGVRASFRDPPRRIPTNLFIAPGGDPPADLLADLREGIWLLSLRPTPAMASSEDRLVAVGFGRRVRDGKPDAAVSGALVSWPLADLLRGVVGVGNDLTFGIAGTSYGAPSLLVSRLGVRAP